MSMRFVMLLPILAALSACQVTDGSSPSVAAETPAAHVTLNGIVTYRQRIALPQDARLKVVIADVSRADAPALVIAETEIQTAGKQVPISFTLDYDPAQIDPRGSYAVSARITDASGALLWINDQRFDLPAPNTPANLMLVQVRP